MDEAITIQSTRRSRRAETGAALEHAVRHGQLVRLRPGAYVGREAMAAASPTAVHRARIEAARRAARHEPVFSHESAAALHGIPLLGRWPEHVRTTVSRATNSSLAVRRTLRALDDADVLVLPDGTHVTAPARTAIDLAAERSLLAGIVAVSHVCAGGTGRVELEAALARLGRFPGVRRARLALERSSAHSRGVLDTLVVVRCQDYGFETPMLQRPVMGIDDREHIADFAWCGGEVLAVCDPRDRGGDVATADDAWSQLRLEDALRPACRAFLRISWVDAWAGSGLATRLIAAEVPREARRFVELTR